MDSKRASYPATYQGALELEQEQEDFTAIIPMAEWRRRKFLTTIVSVLVALLILAIALPTALVLPRMFDPLVAQIAHGTSLKFRLPIYSWFVESLVVDEPWGSCLSHVSAEDETFYRTVCRETLEQELTPLSWRSMEYGPVVDGPGGDGPGGDAPATRLAMDVAASQPTHGLALTSVQPHGPRPWENTPLLWAASSPGTNWSMSIDNVVAQRTWLLMWNVDDEQTVRFNGTLQWMTLDDGGCNVTGHGARAAELYVSDYGSGLLFLPTFRLSQPPVAGYCAGTGEVRVRFHPRTTVLALTFASIGLVILTVVAVCCAWLTRQLRSGNPIVRRLRVAQEQSDSFP